MNFAHIGEVQVYSLRLRSPKVTNLSNNSQTIGIELIDEFCTHRRGSSLQFTFTLSKSNQRNSPNCTPPSTKSKMENYFSHGNAPCIILQQTTLLVYIRFNDQNNPIDALKYIFGKLSTNKIKRRKTQLLEFFSKFHFLQCMHLTSLNSSTISRLAQCH